MQSMSESSRDERKGDALDTFRLMLIKVVFTFDCSLCDWKERIKVYDFLRIQTVMCLVMANKESA